MWTCPVFYIKVFLLYKFGIQDTDSNREIERDFTGDKDGGKKQSNSMRKGSWEQIQGENQTDYTTKILISLSRKSTSKKNN